MLTLPRLDLRPMLPVKLALAVLFLALSLAVPSAQASDWEEDKPKQQAKQLRAEPADTSIIDDDAVGHVHRGPNGAALLQGNATAVRTAPQPQEMTSSEVSAERAQRVAAVQRIDAEAFRFLQMAPTNVVTPPAVFRGFLEQAHPEFDLNGPANNSDSILVIRGQWDDSTKPLHSFGLKFDSIKPKDLPEHSLTKYKVVIVDCAGEMPKEVIKKITDFVGYGGYLLSTDWSLQNTLELAFPGFLQWNRDNCDGQITDAFILDTDSPLLSGLNGLSQCVRILNPARVHMIARSSRLSLQDPQLGVLPDPLLAGGLALEFNFGRGKVLHLVGHFDNCSTSFRVQNLPDPAPGAGISLRQVIAANFIIEALKQTKDAAAPGAEAVPAKTGRLDK